MYEKLTTQQRHLGPQHGDSLPIKVPHRRLHKFLDTAGRVFEVEVEGGKKHLVHLDSIQWDHMGNKLLHISFHKLRAGVKTTVSIPVHWAGESVGQREGGIIHHQLSEIEVEGLPKDIPEYIEVDVSELEINGTLHLSDISAPKGCEWVTEEDLTIVSCQPPRPEEEIEEAVSPADTPEVSEAEEGAEDEDDTSDENSSEDSEETKKAS